MHWKTKLLPNKWGIKKNEQDWTEIWDVGEKKSCDVPWMWDWGVGIWWLKQLEKKAILAIICWIDWKGLSQEGQRWGVKMRKMHGVSQGFSSGDGEKRIEFRNVLERIHKIWREPGWGKERKEVEVVPKGTWREDNGLVSGARESEDGGQCSLVPRDECYKLLQYGLHNLRSYSFRCSCDRPWQCLPPILNMPL